VAATLRDPRGEAVLRYRLTNANSPAMLMTGTTREFAAGFLLARMADAIRFLRIMSAFYAHRARGFWI
jgi:hypothetical protein